MSEKEEEKEKTPVKKQIEELRSEIERRGMEIQELRKKVEELRGQISQEKTHEKLEIDDMLKEVSETLNVGLNVFGLSSKRQDEKTGSRGLLGLIGDLAKLAEESRSYRKEFKFGGKRGVIDFTVRAGPLKRSGRASLGKPRRRIAGRKHYIHTPVEVNEKRDPLVDIFDEENVIKVMADLPGIERGDIDLDLTNDLLTIKVDTPTRKYYKQVKLPALVEKKILEATYKNGILEIKLKKIA
jgi:HSP20 family protein